MEILQTILNRKKKRSAAGEDRITYEMLRQLSPEVKQNLIVDLNRMWRNGCPDDSLKLIKVVAIPKPGRDQNTAAGKRPISLVPRTSFGFRKHSSTNSCFTYVVNHIKANKREGYVSAMICIDLSNAFNAVQTNTLERILDSYLVPSEINVWITGFLRNRRVIPVQFVHGQTTRDIRWRRRPGTIRGRFRDHGSRQKYGCSSKQGARETRRILLSGTRVKFRNQRKQN